MIDPTLISNLGPYSAQVAVVAVLAGLLPFLFRIQVPVIRYAYWRVVFVLCLVLPWLQRATRGVEQPASETATSVTTLTTVALAPIAPAVPTLDWAAILGVVIAIGVVARLLWMSLGFVRLHRLRNAGEASGEDECAALQETVGARAIIRYVDGLRQPVTFGLRKPVVLLPESLRSQSDDIREAVLAHELVHVRRRDWGWVIGEELVRAVLWFHPAIWWLISRVQLAREEVVDATVVALTGRRRSYVEALLSFADATPLAPAPAFAWQRHLFHRIVLISREDAMSARRLVGSCVVMLLVVASGTWYVVGAFPMSERPAAQEIQMEAGPLERSANPVSADNRIPRRLSTAAAIAPPQLATNEGGAIVTLRVTVNSAGEVAEARATRLMIDVATPTVSITFTNAPIADVYTFVNDLGRSKGVVNSEPKLMIDAVINAAIMAAREWRYESPSKPPIAFDIAIPVGNAPPPPPPGTASTSRSKVAASTMDTSGALRVGGNISQPKKIKHVAPVYPPEAQQGRVQGVVIIEARIGADGRVEDAAVLRSIPLLDQAALDAVRQWEFTPTLMNGVATPVIMTVTVQFSLQ